MADPQWIECADCDRPLPDEEVADRHVQSGHTVVYFPLNPSERQGNRHGSRR